MRGDNAMLTAEAVTRKTGVEPTRSGEAGDRVGRRSTASRTESLWLITSAPGIEDGRELGEQLGRLLAVLEPVAGELWELADAGYEANWYCWVESHATEHAVEIDRQLMQRLLALPGDLWLDVCGDGEDEDQQPGLAAHRLTEIRASGDHLAHLALPGRESRADLAGFGFSGCVEVNDRCTHG